MKNLLDWLAEVLLGPRCPRCEHRARGTRDLMRHTAVKHPTAVRR